MHKRLWRAIKSLRSKMKTNNFNESDHLRRKVVVPWKKETLWCWSGWFIDSLSNLHVRRQCASIEVTFMKLFDQFMCRWNTVMKNTSAFVGQSKVFYQKRKQTTSMIQTTFEGRWWSLEIKKPCGVDPADTLILVATYMSKDNVLR